MPYRAFYCCNSTNEIVESTDAYEIELDWARNIVFDILRDDGDFFGLTDDAGVTIQFMREQDRVWMEIPSPKDRGSFGRHIDILEVGSAITSLPANLSPREMDGFEFQPW